MMVLLSFENKKCPYDNKRIIAFISDRHFLQLSTILPHSDLKVKSFFEKIQQSL